MSVLLLLAALPLMTLAVRQGPAPATYAIAAMAAVMAVLSGVTMLAVLPLTVLAVAVGIKVRPTKAAT